MTIEVKGTIVSSSEGWIYGWFGIECTTPEMIAKALKEANGESVEVNINSGGGDLFAGIEIYSALRAYSGDVTIHIVGLAASAASIIACAGKSDISPAGMLMIHNVSSCASGDYHDMEHEAEVLKKCNKAVVGAYVAKTGMAENELLAMMDKEEWLSSSEAVELGFIDSIAKENGVLTVAASASATLLPRAVINKMITDKKSTDKMKAELELLKLKGEI